ncbi:MAG: TonB-dependent receptor [Gammaproteobacteria bacterium]|nr:TonB-dependent receptor [Pseudomonadales bacterium]MCP5347274.1 TonB-dependent receptor [Pseudomonadales bacterium]
MTTFTHRTRQLLQIGAFGIAGALLPAMSASAQVSLNDPALFSGTGVKEPEDQHLVLPIIRIERETEQRDLQGLYGEQSTDLNLGLEITPVQGLSFRADAWSIQDRPAPAQALGPTAGLHQGLSRPFLATEPGRDFSLEQPFLGNSLESNGIDLGAAYVWEAGNAGRFTLETTATLINDFEQHNGLVDSTQFLDGDKRLPGSPDLQGSLTLTWEIGNHSASAVTNYFDSVKDISELDAEEINRLVENITTVDLQYGYNVTTGKQDRAVISFSLGIRNIFDKKTTQILNQNSRVVDQNGRVAYGSIKYQF